MVTERELLERAREMRRNPTEWEGRVWRHLSNSQLGHKFRRQHVIFPHICDFFCSSKGLIVEIDGDTHDAPYDERRNSRLANNGVLTLRFTNIDARDNIEGLMASIISALSARADRWPSVPHPNPVAGKRCPASFRSCRGHDRPATPEGEGLEE